MHFRSTAILLTFVLLLGAFILLVERRGHTTREREEQARRVLQVDAGRISFLRFETGTLLVECVREGEEWMIVQPVRARAAQAEIARILTGLENLPKGEVITAAERRARNLELADYGLGEPRAVVTYGDSMHRRTILVGRDAPLGDQLYVKGQQQEDVVATSTNLVSLLPASVSSLRDRALFRVGPERVQRIELSGASGFLQLVRQDRGQWMIQQPVMTRAATLAVTAWLDNLHQMRVEKFVSDAGADGVVYGFADPMLRITAWYGERDGETTLELGQALKEDASLLYVRRKGEDFVYAVSTNILSHLRLGLDDLRDKRLTALSVREVSHIEIGEADRRLVLQEKDGAWNVTEPRQWKADEERVRELLSAWVAAPVLSFIDGAGTNLAAHGFLPPEQRLVLAYGASGLSGARDADVARIRVGGPQKEAARTLVKVEGDDVLREIDAAARNTLSTDPLFFRDREVLSISRNDVVSITIQEGERTQSVKRDATGMFRPVDEEQFVLIDKAVDDILMVVGELKVVEFVADDPDDLTPYGLVEPAAVLTIGLRSEAGISRSVLLGHDAGNIGVHAMLRGRDLVFVLEKAVRSVLLQTLYAVPASAVQESLDADTVQ